MIALPFPYRSRFPRMLIGALWGMFVFPLAILAADSSEILSQQTAVFSGSNSSFVTIGTGGLSQDGTASGTVEYVNKDSDQNIYGNFLKGHYYDSVFGFFRLDWSENPENNVRFVASTNRCVGGYGYVLGGYAYSKYAGFVAFNHSSETFVYYCEDDRKLHGYAYGDGVGFQSFEGISFETISWIYRDVLESGGNSNFVNDTTIILQEIPEELRPSLIQGERQSSSWGVESIFYIVK